METCNLEHIGGTHDVDLHHRIRIVPRHHWAGMGAAMDDATNPVARELVHPVDVAEIAFDHLPECVRTGLAVYCNHTVATLLQDLADLVANEPGSSSD